MTVARAFALDGVNGRLLLTDGDPTDDHAYENLAAWVACPDGQLMLCYSMATVPVQPVGATSRLSAVKARAKRVIKGLRAYHLNAKRARRAKRRLIGWSSQPAA